MKMLSVSTGPEWVNVRTSTAEIEAIVDQAEREATKVLLTANNENLKQAVTDLLLAENLIVLCGLGTSLGKPPERLGPTMVELWDEAERCAAAKFDKIKAAVNYDFATFGKNIELLLSHCQMSEALKPQTLITDFVKDSEKIIVEKCRFVSDTSALNVHEAFLRKVARRSTRQPRMKLFTTNYDICFEHAASSNRFVVIDGFSHTQPQRFDGSYFGYDLVRRESERTSPDYIQNVFHLYKLHGSVDWKIEGSEIIKDSKAEKPLIIYPRFSKFESSYGQPFLESMSRFQSFLRQPNTGLLAIGSGFNDSHITQPVLAAISANVSLKVIILGPELEQKLNPAIKHMTAAIKAGDWRISLVNGFFSEFVEAVPDLVQVLEAEQHEQRTRVAGSSQ